MKNIKKQWYIYVIIVIILLLSIASWICTIKNIVTNTNDDSNLTTIDKDNNIFTNICKSFDNFIEDISDGWTIYNDSNFSKIDLITTYFETGELSSLQVIAGINGWLFYGSKTDGNSIGDYEGTNSFTDDEMLEIYNSVLQVQKNMKKKNIKFAILVPSNKENIYSEYMPENYIHSNQSRTDLLIKYLSNKGINIISPKQELLKYHNDFQLYYSYDTHWNQLGAYIGVKEVLKSWNIDLQDLPKRTISSSKLKNEYHYCGEDDLAKMLDMRSFFSDELEYTIDGTIKMDWTKFQTEQENNQISYFYNDNANIDAKLLIVGDSFRSSTIPTLREQFSNVYVAHRTYFTSDMMNDIKPDYVIIEYVERYSNNINDISNLFE